MRLNLKVKPSWTILRTAGLICLLVATVVGFAVTRGQPHPASASVDDPRITALFGTYEILGYEPGDLDSGSHQRGLEMIGSEIIIRPDEFRDWVGKTQNPSYRLTVDKLYKDEGEVLSKHWSAFWGWGVNRDSMIILHVGNPEVSNEYRTFEVIGNGVLWEVSGGGIFIYKRRGE